MNLRIRCHGGIYAVWRLAPDAPLPSSIRGDFTSITRTPDELSIVCESMSAPADAPVERGWRLLSVAGPIPFETTGVAAALIGPLSAAGISVFLIATYDTDYLLLKEDSFARALRILREAGHEVANPEN